MSIPKLLNHSNYMRRSTETNPTTRGDMYQYFDNVGTVLESTVQAVMWQPSTAYKAGAIVQSPSIPAGYIARCSTAGTSSESEPEWKAGTITDNSVKWTVTVPVTGADKATTAEAKAGTGEKVVTVAAMKAAIDAAIATATAAIETQAKLDAHPVGSYYWSNDSTSPATLFGGTWEALPAGYTLIAQGSGTDDYGSFTYTAGQKYGERKHPLSTDELPKFTPSFDGGGTAFVANNTKYNDTAVGLMEGSLWGNTSKTILAPFNSIGNNVPYNNLQPSICAYCWKRTA